MSSHKSSWIAIGFDFEIDTILDEIKRVTSVVTHMEDRFDPKTGKRVEPEEVEDEPEVVEYVFKSAIYTDDEVTELLAHIAEELGCDAHDYAMYSDGRVVFALELKESRGSIDMGDADAGPNYWLESLTSNITKLDGIARALRDLGYEPPEPQIIQCWDIN